MTALVPIEAGTYAVLMADLGWSLYWPGDTLAQRAEKLFSSNVDGWDSRGHNITIARIDRVMPKTFAGAFLNERKGSFEGHVDKRISRYEVIARAQSLAAAKALRAKLLKIGEDAEAEIRRELAIVVPPIERRVRAEALAKVHAALPHIFGRAS